MKDGEVLWLGLQRSWFRWCESQVPLQRWVSLSLSLSVFSVWPFLAHINRVENPFREFLQLLRGALGLFLQPQIVFSQMLDLSLKTGLVFFFLDSKDTLKVTNVMVNTKSSPPPPVIPSCLHVFEVLHCLHQVQKNASSLGDRTSLLSLHPGDINSARIWQLIRWQFPLGFLQPKPTARSKLVMSRIKLSSTSWGQQCPWSKQEMSPWASGKEDHFLINHQGNQMFFQTDSTHLLVPTHLENF